MNETLNDDTLNQSITSLKLQYCKNNKLFISIYTEYRQKRHDSKKIRKTEETARQQEKPPETNLL